MGDVTLDRLSKRIRAFCRERDWEQYHNPKNLSMSVAIEAAELMEIFQWLTSGEAEPSGISDEMKSQVKDEIADIMIYCIRMAQVLDFDLLFAVENKIEKNNAKYPVAKVKGKAGI